ncbi:MAG: hypothetical protein HZA93_05610 [Verrucomicrobia bacterium]|nr:hypothetical protein [Verrucomicrobiota bacterium]
MKWIVLAIVVVIVPYTFITLRYRKPGPAYQPYEDMKNRANTVRLLSAGFQRVALVASRPAAPSHAVFNATFSAAPGGLPSVLRATLVEPPLLPASISSVAAAPTVDAGKTYSIQFTCMLPDNKQQLAGAVLYIRPKEIFITPEFEKLTGDLLSRTRESVVHVTVPAGLLKSGSYRITLLGAQASRAWTVQVH